MPSVGTKRLVSSLSSVDLPAPDQIAAKSMSAPRSLKQDASSPLGPMIPTRVPCLTLKLMGVSKMKGRPLLTSYEKRTFCRLMIETSWGSAGSPGCLGSGVISNCDCAQPCELHATVAKGPRTSVSASFFFSICAFLVSNSLKPQLW